MEHLRESFYYSSSEGTNQFSFDDENSTNIVSDYVHNVANGIYKEFESLIMVHGESVVKNLMPLVVSCLETLDRVYNEKHNIEVEFELLKEDSSQLMIQYEREKQLRKGTEESLFKTEDNFVEKCSKYEEKMQSFESTQKMYEIRLRNCQDQLSRFEERDTERQKEYEKLHSRYTELVRYHMDYLEKSRMYQSEMTKSIQVEKSDQSYSRDRLFSEKTRLSVLGEPPQEISEKISDVTEFRSPINSQNEIALSEELGNHIPAKVVVQRHPINFTSDTIAEWDLTSIKSDELNPISDCEEIPSGTHILPLDDELAGMSHEIECIIKENNELIATKNALNIVKDDLISKLDEANSVIDIMQYENNSLNTMKTSLKLRLNDLEIENKSLKQDLLFWKQKAAEDNDEDNVPISQRKRFTRVEMARVLMERNQYKERLLELEERLKLSAMSQNRKERGLTLWEKFSRLFKGNNQESSSNASSISEKSSDKNKNTPKINDPVVNCFAMRDPKRQQINGWSLPKSISSRMKSNLPVPIYCRPLLENQSGLKDTSTLEITCAVSVNMKGGSSEQGDMYVGSSIFYDRGSSQQSINPDLLEIERKLNQSRIISEFGNLTNIEPNEMKCSSESQVWIVTSSNDESQIIIIDANRPSDYLDTFMIPNAPVQCLGSIPGATQNDYLQEKIEISSEIKAVSSSNISDETPSFRVSKIECLPYEECDASQPLDVTVDTKMYDSMMKKVVLSSIKSTSSISDVRRSEEKLFPDAEDSNISAHQTSTAQDYNSIQPTIWIGCRNGDLFVHPATGIRSHCLHQIRLPDSITNIIHQDSRVFVSLANGAIAVFRRYISDDFQKRHLFGQWQMSNYYLIEPDCLGHSIRCLEGVVLSNSIWIGYRNKIVVINDKSFSLISGIEAHPRSEYTVRQMCSAGDGVWVSLRLDTILRLFHAFNFQHLQDLNVEPHINKLIEPSLLGLSLLRITCLSASCHRLWIGTNNGMVICAPFLQDTTNKKPSVQEAVESLLETPAAENLESLNNNLYSPTFIPFINNEDLQLSYHGHRDAVKFFITVRSDSNAFRKPELNKREEIRIDSSSLKLKFLILSGGEGYKDFRLSENSVKAKYLGAGHKGSVSSVDHTMHNSHLIVWQLSNMDST